jgi:hypothetical protein
MSSTANKNTNTHTSTSRRNKAKPAKMTLGEFHAHNEQPLEAPIAPEVEAKVEVVVEPTANPVEAEVVPTPEQAPLEELVVKPVVNVWEERRKKAAEAALKAAEALQAADDALKAAEAAKKVAQELANKTVQVAKPSPAPEAQEVEAEDDGFVKVGANGKRKPQPQQAKPQQAKPQQAKPQQAKPQQAKPQQAQPQQAKPQGKPHGQYQGKPRQAHWEPTEEQKAARALKAQALETARSQMIDQCVQLVPKKDIDGIRTALQYVVNFRKTLLIDLSDDALMVETGSEKFQFSRIHFIEDRTFQYKVRERFAQVLPEAWIKFFPGRKEGTYCIGLSRRNN